MELGKDIPKAWTKQRIGGVGEVVTGRTPSTKREDFYGGNCNLISPADLDNGKYVFTAHKKLSREGLQECRVLPKDAVLVGCIGNVGKLGMVADDRSATNQQINAIIVSPSNDPHFVYYSLQANRGSLEQAADKTTLPILNKTNFQNFEILVPPLGEQRKIAAVLGWVQRTMEQQDRLLALTAELKKAILHRVFTTSLHGEPQMQTDIGLVPKSWELVSVGKTGKVVTGSTPSTKRPEFYGGDYNLISPADLDEGKFITSAHRKLTKLGLAECRVLPKNAVVVGCIGNIGKIGLTANDKCATNQQINAIICGKDFNPQFVYYSLQYYRPRLERAAAKVTLPILNKSNFESFLIAAPKKSVQDEIANALSVLDDKIDIVNRKKRTLESLFRTLLHQLMSAQVRVRDLVIPELDPMP